MAQEQHRPAGVARAEVQPPGCRQVESSRESAQFEEHQPDG